MKWFKHDSDANHDPKLQKVLMKYGAEGYALYWLCLECIAAPIDKNNINFELEHDAEVLAYRLRMDSLRVEEIMRYMVELRLFEIDATTKRISCLKLAARLENSIVKNPELKQIQQLIDNDPGQSRIIPDNLGKVRLEENRLDKKRIEKKRGSKRVPQSWKVSEDGIAYAKKMGMTQATIDYELEKQRNTEYKQPRKDWDAAWRRWCMTWKEHGGKQAEQPRKPYEPPPPEDPEENKRKFEENVRRLQGMTKAAIK